MKKFMLLIFSVSFFLTGCATIVGDKTQTVQVNSNPAGADFIIKDESGKTISSGKTPQNVTLEKSDGSYFGKKSYQITFSKENYQPVTLPIKASANGWYIGGNFVFGGIVGWLLVDPFNGGMYTLSPGSLNPGLVPET
ncbi:TPA: hypothetical protein ACWK9C_004871 [Escherichia coli]|jgi:uncharacterized protein YceK|uniref:PEGA domain-containing protein n=2 Tax=Escherichia coli TaxID=562 RepID=A0A376W782_ECOLX|nr:hypothetical protein [Escherichia coli]EFA6268262.1 hypothetical protein [Escherichia coli]EFB5473558.1 hypothetical protein [Escherichia coli]EFE0667023.1 hypothetical protein [Escherichia coli]EFE8186162.1 hypothetical protein [Escherichia coli]EFI7814580.1 hypothetical protein [Escherichia coli]